MASLAGKTALVTGGERGIGRAICLRLAADGARLFVNYPGDGDAAAAVVSEILAAGGHGAVVRGDVARVADVSAMFAEIGALDILVNNAGIGIPAALSEIAEDMLDRTFAVNVKGAVFCAQEASRRMPRGGSIVNLSSSTVLFPLPGMSVYTATKAAVRALTDVWAKELGPAGIRVNSVLPGPTSPGMADLASPALKESVARASPFGRIGQADEVAAAVAFLAGDDARWISGHHLVVNGAAAA